MNFLNPFEYYAPQIADEIAKVQPDIDFVDKRIESVKKRLFSFAGNSDPEDSFVRHAAMLGLLEKFGLKDIYYDPVPDIATFYVSDNMWSLHMPIPRGPNYFLITYAEVRKTTPAIQIVYYGKSN